MVTDRRTKRELADEVDALRARVAELEAATPAPRLEGFEGLYRSVFDAVPFGLAISREGGPVESANPGLAEILGRTEEQIVGTRLASYGFDGDDGSLSGDLREAWAADATRDYDRILQRADGTPLEVHATAKVIVDPATGERWMLRIVRDVTMEKLAARQLEESERAYRGLFESSPIGIVIEDESRQILSCNPAFVAMTGLRADEVPHTNLRDFTRVPTESPPIGGFSRILAGEADVSWAEREWRAPGTSIEWVEVVNAAVRGEKGQFLFAFGMVSDITEKKRAAGLLEESERKYRSLFEAAPVGVSIADAHRAVIDANSAFLRMADLPKDQLVGERLSGFVEPRNGDETATTFEDLVAGRADTDRQQRRWLSSRTGVEWVEFTSSAVRDDNGKFLYVIVVWQDITERLRAERQLAESERKYRGLFEAAPAGVVIVDRDRNIIEMNPAFQHMAALKDGETHGRHTSEFVGRPDADPTALVDSPAGGRTLFDDLIDGVVDQAHQERHWIAPGSDIQWVEIHNSAVRDDNGEFLYAIGITRDITPRRRAERQRRELFWRLAASAEDQRREIARELHDEIGQQLTGLKMQLEIGTPAAVDRAQEIAEELMKRVRNVSLDLRPAVLDDLGLVPALRSQFHRYTERTGVAVVFTNAGVDERMSNEIEVAAFRIVQEALTNVARHAGVQRARVTLAFDSPTRELRVTIADEGRGTTRTLGPAPAGAESIGLSGMAERAAAVGGALTFTSSPGGGAVVSATIPVPTPE